MFASLFSILVTVREWVIKWPKDNPTPVKKEKETRLAAAFHPVIQELRLIIEEDADLYMGFCRMFEQIPNDPKYDTNPLGEPQIRNYQDMLKMFDALLTYSPEFGDGPQGDLVPLPISVGLNWALCTSAGFWVFTNPKVNAQLKKILTVWADFLSSPESRCVLTDGPNGWFGPSAKKTLPNFEETYECDPGKEYSGFSSWDDFFTRRFRLGARPISHPDDDTVIVNPGEPYSLYHMLNNDALSVQFVGGTVIQAYLSIFNYHRWHSPVNGHITKIVRVPGTYCAALPASGFENDGAPSLDVTTASQAFLAHLATRVLILIQADHADIGLMCFIGIGMVEISSCEATVVEGQRVRKGDQLGMFHYGGSTQCLVFRPETKVVFSDSILRSLEDGKTNVLINSCIAHLSTKSG